MLLFALAWATDPVFQQDFQLDDYLVTDVVCVEQEGPPNGAIAIMRSPLGWAHQQRMAIHGGGYPEDPDREQLMRWLPVAPEAREVPVAFELSVARAPIEGDWIVQVEAHAFERRPVVAPNFTIVVDTSGSMETVHERRLPILQDEPGVDYRAVSRAELIRTALKELFQIAPEFSKVSIVAMDALQARAIIPPTRLERAGVVYGAIEKLEHGVVVPEDKLTADVLDRVSDKTFDRCHDNKVILLTDHVDQLVQKKAVQDVARWAADDVEVWSFGVGLNDDIEADIALLGQAAGGASWLINSASDFREVWRHILDPGGVVASDVFIQVDFPPGSEWKDISENGPMRTGSAHYSAGTMRSGEKWARVFEVHVGPDAQLADLGATFVHERDVRHIALDEDRIPPFEWASPTLRARTLASYWVNDPDVLPTYRLGDVLSHFGESSELRAWLEHIRVRRLGQDDRMPEFEDWVGPNNPERFNPFENARDPRDNEEKPQCVPISSPLFTRTCE